MACHAGIFATLGSVLLVVAPTTRAQETVSSQSAGAKTSPSSSSRTSDLTPANVLTPVQWRRVDTATSRALSWLASQQQPDGSFPTLDSGQPAITGLCMMAFIAHGHVPGKGQYGPRLERASDYVLSCQKQNGLVAKLGPDDPELTRQVSHEIGGCATYNHAISSLVLSEMYGMSPPARARRLESAIRKAIAATLEMQAWSKNPAD